MAKDKPPRLDIFSPLFFKRYWSIIQVEVVEVMREFFATGVMSMNWMRTFITLVHKKPNATKPSHYHPINWCTTLYKFCAKFMVNRIKPILPRFISLE